MIVKDFLDIWSFTNHNDLIIQYYFKGAKCSLFTLRNLYSNEVIDKIKLNITTEQLVAENIVYDLSNYVELSYDNETLLENLKPIIPIGTIGIILNIFIE